MKSLFICLEPEKKVKKMKYNRDVVDRTNFFEILISKNIYFKANTRLRRTNTLGGGTALPFS